MADMDNLGDFDNEIDEPLMSHEQAALLAFSFILKPYDILVDMKTTNFHFSSTCGPGKDRRGQSSGPRVCISFPNLAANRVSQKDPWRSVLVRCATRPSFFVLFYVRTTRPILFASLKLPLSTTGPLGS
jgi:hypothetical protein